MCVSGVSAPNASTSPNSATFTFGGVTNQGAHVVAIAAGAITDLQGTPVAPASTQMQAAFQEPTFLKCVWLIGLIAPAGLLPPWLQNRP